jgi:hypothetical protein
MGESMKLILNVYKLTAHSPDNSDAQKNLMTGVVKDKLLEALQ